MVNHTILEGDCREKLKKIRNDSIQCVITSPPYWGVRSYGIKGEIGSEPEFEDYLANLENVFSELYRVISSDGVLWLNIGDVYSSGNRKYRHSDRAYGIRGMETRPKCPEGIKPKDLIGAPWRLASLLRDIGYYLRAEIIWQKRNCMPESVVDRPTRKHEFIFLLSKSERYYFDNSELKKCGKQFCTSIWDVPVTPSKIPNHGATFPPDIVKPCVLSSTHENDLVLDPFAGSLTVRRVCKTLNRNSISIELNETYVHDAAKLAGAI